MNLPRPTESELEILQVLWLKGACTVREVNDQLSDEKQREVGYTTTLKLMQIMADKGLVRRDTDQRTHVYEAAIPEAEVRQGLLRRFVDTAFRGSAAQLVLEALGQHQAKGEELDEIKKLIERMEQGADDQSDSTLDGTHLNND